jgi:hypothetical protein
VYLLQKSISGRWTAPYLEMIRSLQIVSLQKTNFSFQEPIHILSIDKQENHTFYSNWSLTPLINHSILSERFSVTPTEKADRLYIRSNEEPVADWAVIYVPLTDIDTTINEAFIDNSFLYSTYGAISETEKLLIHIRKKNEDSYFSPALILTQLNYGNIHYPFKTVWLSDSKTIDLPDSEWAVYSVYSAKNEFIVSTNSKTYIISEEGEILSISNIRFYNIIEFKNELYAIGNSAALYKSTDRGRTWNQIGNLPTQNIKFFIIGDNLFFFTGQQIALLDMDEMYAHEIENDGLESNEITSVSGFNGKIYASTLSGLFFTNDEDFLKFKYSKESEQ